MTPRAPCCATNAAATGPQSPAPAEDSHGPARASSGTVYYRIKGVLDVADSDHQHVVQAVREVYEIQKWRRWKEDDEQGRERGPPRAGDPIGLMRQNHIVIIGQNLDGAEEYKRSFEAACRAGATM